MVGTTTPMQGAANDFLKRAFRGGNSKKIAREAHSVVERANKEADGIIARMHTSAQERAREIILERRARRQAWEALPWWKKMFYPCE